MSGTRAGPRCPWCGEDPLYVAYHDEEWGVPTFDRRTLFAMLCLEGQQAGLSWITVLRKRPGYFRAFRDFVPERVARMTPAHLDKVVLDPGVIRHRGKLEAIVENARAVVAMEKGGEKFVDFVWSFVDGKPVQNAWRSMSEIPAETALSNAMSKGLKARGFRFVGPTTCYAFMQACGLLNDHLRSCPWWAVCGGGR